MGISAIENARVRITEDEMEAYLSLPPLEEGESYSMNQVIAFIRSQKVVACIDEETVRRMIDTPVYGHEVCIAKGKRVVNGLDGTLTYQFNTDINTRPEIRDQFGKCNVYTKEACKDCFARFYCSGGCAANAYHFQKDINGNYGIGCELQRKRVECAIMIKAALAE